MYIYTNLFIYLYKHKQFEELYGQNAQCDRQSNELKSKNIKFRRKIVV